MLRMHLFCLFDLLWATLQVSTETFCPVKVAEHSLSAHAQFTITIKLTMIRHPLPASVKVNHRRMYSHIFVKVCAVAWQWGWLKTRLKKWFLLIKKKSSGYILFVIRCKSFLVVLKIPYVKIQISWEIIHMVSKLFFGQFLEIQTTWFFFK